MVSLPRPPLSLPINLALEFIKCRFYIKLMKIHKYDILLLRKQNADVNYEWKYVIQLDDLQLLWLPDWANSFLFVSHMRYLRSTSVLRENAFTLIHFPPSCEKPIVQEFRYKLIIKFLKIRWTALTREFPRRYTLCSKPLQRYLSTFDSLLAIL